MMPSFESSSDLRDSLRRMLWNLSSRSSECRMDEMFSKERPTNDCIPPSRFEMRTLNST